MKLAPGSSIGSYQILGLIGAGGMGEVYKARDPQLGRDAAVKVLPEHISAQKEALARLENEARLASSLNHPHIVTIYSIGWEGPQRYIAMEFIDGSTLQDLIDAGPMPVDQAIRVAAQIADGLAKAHEAGIVHRDLKPKNVMLTKDGIAKILDFGLSKFSATLVDSEAPTPTYVDPSDGFTKPGTILGTVEYMSPEQAAGRPLDFRSDQFSMGSLIYAILTGKKPFHRETPIQTLSSIIETEPQPVSQLNPRVPQALETVIRRCLMKDPRQRYASTRDLAHDLRQLEIIRRMPARHWSRRDWLRAVVVLGFLVLLAGGLWTWFHRPYQPGSEALRWYQNGQAALNSMTFDTARKAFERAVGKDSKFVLAHANLAIVYDLLGYSGLATESMVHALAAAREVRLSGIDQKRLDAFQHIVSREYDLAVPVLRELENEAADRDKPAAALQSGWLAEKREDTKGAAAAYARAIQMEPGFPAARLRLGYIQQRQGENEKALASFGEAEKLYDATNDLEGTTEVLYQRANLLNRRNRAGEALPIIRKGIELANAIGNGYQEIQLKLLESAAVRNLGQFERAAQLAQSAIDQAELEKMDNLATSGMIALGNAFHVEGDYESAERCFSRALDIAKRGKVLRYEAMASLSLASIYEQKNEPEKSIRYAKAAMSFYRQAGYRRELAQTMSVLGGSFLAAGDFDQGTKILNEALPIAISLQDSRSEVQVRDRIAEILQASGNWPEALKQSELSGKLSGGTFARLDSAGLYWRLGRLQDAERSLQALEQVLLKGGEPQYVAMLWLRRAEIAYVEGHFEQAKAMAQLSISAVPATGDQAEPEARIIEALALVHTGQQAVGTKAALNVIRQLDESGAIAIAVYARLSTALALADAGERSLSLKLALDALNFFEQHNILESAWRGHLAAARVSGRDEAGVHGKSARAALEKLRRSWPAEDVNRYLQRPDIKLLSSRMQF